MRDLKFIYYNKLILLSPSIYSKLKFVLDIFIALLGLILSLPLMLFSAFAIKISSKGPVFFKQERLGLNKVPFTLIKFRTMIDNAEKDTGPKWASKNDPRITKVGKFLRKTRLDELPQLFNVLKGDMSFVGPRPIRQHFADLLSKEIPNYNLRFSVKPGITGWAQVMGDYAGSVEKQKDKFEYDLYYILNKSIWLDLFIIFKTIRTVLLFKGQ
ncbi:MAG: exopolysaccharide biosynthesis polyprenyl glycosylphosphotransferase [Candidatus Woesearchaeota archaeon]